MNCPECDSTMKTGTMLCTNNDWRINDNSGNLKMIVEIHDISDGDEEIGDTYSREYCECGQFPPIVSFEEIAYTESDVVNNLMSINSFDESESIDLIKNTNPYVKDWSI